MVKPNPKKARKHLEKLREIIAKDPSPIFKMSKEDVIDKLRKTREELWETKITALSCREPGGYYMKNRTTKKASPNEATKLPKELRESIAKKPSPFAGMSKEEVIQHMRKTRNILWEKKFAPRP